MARWSLIVSCPACSLQSAGSAMSHNMDDSVQAGTCQQVCMLKCREPARLEMALPERFRLSRRLQLLTAAPSRPSLFCATVSDCKLSGSTASRLRRLFLLRSSCLHASVHRAEFAKQSAKALLDRRFMEDASCCSACMCWSHQKGCHAETTGKLRKKKKFMLSAAGWRCYDTSSCNVNSHEPFLNEGHLRAFRSCRPLMLVS